MAAEQQLERSVLERKERDELRVIAEAMSLEMNSRTKKADIIDQILRAAGVEVASSGSGNGEGDLGASRRVVASAKGDTGGELATNAALQAGDEKADRKTRPSSRADGQDAQATEDHPDVPAGNGQVDQVSAPARTGAASGPGRQQNQPGGGEPGNRRGRRRRGRQPGGHSAERELQGGGAETQYSGELVPVRGLLDLRDEGYGFLRAEGYLPSSRDIYVSISQARRFALRKGDYVEGASRPAASNEKFPALIRIDTVCGLTPDEARNRPRFEDLTPLFPDERLRLETSGSAEATTRIIDLLSPIGKGQRGMIVSPPKAGKTTVLKQIAHSIEANNPEVHLIVLLVDERPEEVTDMRRSVKGEVVASTFDRPSDEHTAISELTIDRAKRLVELGRDVVIVLDGITRLARAYNLAQPATGRIMSGGVDSGALYPPKKFFGAARNIEEGGSLTILATALVETGSKMDEVIFEEFKGTGNMELRLDRRLAERRLYPAIDVNASQTRHEELLFERGQLQQVWKLRRVLNALAADGSAAAGLELLIDKIRTTNSNDEFLAEIAKGPAPPV
jgi:transcription termination factor Rho